MKHNNVNTIKILNWHKIRIKNINEHLKLRVQSWKIKTITKDVKMEKRIEKLEVNF